MKVINSTVVLALSISTFFATQSLAVDNKVTTESNSHYTLGIGYSTYSGEDWVVMAGYINDNFLTDIGASFEETKTKNTTPDNNFNIFELRGHIGLRHNVAGKLFFDYGVLGSYGIRSKETDTRVAPYEIGAFTGLSWKALPNLMVAIKVSPYNFERSYNKQEHQRIFSEGSFSVSYLF